MVEIMQENRVDAAWGVDGIFFFKITSMNFYHSKLLYSDHKYWVFFSDANKTKSSEYL